MKYCKKCLQPDTRPNTKFDEFGICPACNYFDTLKDINWEERKKEWLFRLFTAKEKVKC